MKKLLQIGAAFFCILISQNVSAEVRSGAQNACCPADQPVGDCWCRYVRYEPCYYTTKRCIEEQVPCKKKCYRTVPEYYEVTRCKYVPQYYTEKCCRNKVECYEVDDCKTCKRWVCEQQCKYVPKYYWKHVTCPQPACPPACPAPAAGN